MDSIASRIEAVVNPIPSDIEPVIDSVTEPIQESVGRKNRRCACDCDHNETSH